MREPLATEEQALRWYLRQHLAPETDRVVTAVWWGVYNPDDALEDLRGKARLIAQAAGISGTLADILAQSAFDEEMARHEAEHIESGRIMKEAALACMLAGMPEQQVRAIVAQHAKDRPMAPPLNVLTQSMEAARREFRFSTRRLGGNG